MRHATNIQLHRSRRPGQANDIFKNLTHSQGRIDDEHNYYLHEENVDSVIYCTSW